MKSLSCVLLTLVLLPVNLPAERPSTWDGKLPEDHRLQPLIDLNGYFPFEPPQDVRQWEIRAEAIRRRMLVSQGLWPLPRRTPLKPTIHSRVERPGYTMESVYLEATPGFHVTGTLYRPADADSNGAGEQSRKRPGILCPHGHWQNGRFMDRGEAGGKKELEMKAESLMSAARSPLQARCVHLARMGCVVFHYDMIGYADSQQISYQLAHRFAKQRPEWNDPADWGFFSPQAEAHVQSIMGLQTWSSMRALDFLAALPDVDPSRLAVTGASGGGTQSFMLAALDPRIATAVPAVMVSTAMQGGCTCENASGLRVGVGNVEFAALFAPKPLGLTAADDWTKEMETKGFPQLKQLYKLLGAPTNVALWANTQFPHNYNAVSRNEMYKWFNQHLHLNAKTLVDEDFPLASAAELTVYKNGHKRPVGGAAIEHEVIRWWTNDAKEQLAALAKQSDDLGEWREVVGPAIDTMIGRDVPDPKQLGYDQTGKNVHDTYVELVGQLIDTSRKEFSPVLFLYPKQWDGHVVIWLHDEGKAGLLNADGSPTASVAKLLGERVAVAGIDLLGQGEFLQGKVTPTETRRVKNTREAAAYTLGFNHALFAQQVQDVLKMVSFVLAHEYQPKVVSLVGWDGNAGVLAAAARAQTRDVVQAAVINTRGFRFANVNSIRSPMFLPGAAKYGDVPGMLAVTAPAKLWLVDQAEPSGLYRAFGKALQTPSDAATNDRGQLDEALKWLIGIAGE